MNYYLNYYLELFLRQVNYSEKCSSRGLQGWSLNTGCLKDRFDCSELTTNLDVMNFDVMNYYIV